MRAPVQIVFRDVEDSARAEERARHRAGKLSRFCSEISSCQVSVSVPHRQNLKGNLFHVQIRMAVPGKELVVSRNPHEHHEHEDLWVALRDAFDAAERELKRYVARKRARARAQEQRGTPSLQRLRTNAA